MKDKLKIQDKYIRLHNFLISRIYHEDTMLSQRTYNFVTINVFLVAVLAIVFSISKLGNTELVGQQNILKLSLIISVFGIFFALFHFAIGRATERAITFWREYLRVLENMIQLKYDSAMFDFYKTGDTDTGFNIIISSRKKIKKHRLPLSWLPSSFGSTNIWVGVLLPWIVAFFWLFLITYFIYKMEYYILICFITIIFFVLFVVSWIVTPATPYIKQKDKND